VSLPSTSDDPCLVDLTPAQREAVTHLDGPALVLAGPGSGKTRVISRRIAHLVSRGVPAWQILAVTFTNKAAREMERRVDELLAARGWSRRGLTVATFHSFAARFLRQHAAAVGLDPGFSIFDAADQRAALKKAIAAADLSSSQWPAAQVGSVISDAKNRLLDPDAWARSAVDWRERNILRVWREYEALLARSRALDFDDLLARSALALKRHEGVRLAARDRYRYLLVDEYQDTNAAQFAIASAIAGEGGNLFVVGDPDQSIYGWRGADLSNILDFERHYPGAKVVPLGQNFRSTRRVVEAAAALIAHNRDRRDKRIYSELEPGEPPRIVHCLDERHEAETIADAIERASLSGVPLRGMAVLYRVNALSRVLEEVFRRRGLPYTIARGTAFYERKEIKDLISYLRLVANTADEVSLRRIVNTPTRGLGETTLRRLEVWALDAGVGLFEALGRAGEVEGVTSRTASAAARFVAIVRRWSDLAASEEPELLGDLVSTVLRESGLEAQLAAEDGEDGAQRRANLEELVSAASEFEDAPADAEDPDDGGLPRRRLLDALRAWLESVALVSDADRIDPERGSVTLMTLHAAKGLEFPFVAIAGLEQGMLPFSRGIGSEVDLEEERRLCFVGMTRAERQLLMTSAASRMVRGITASTVPSQFLDELPDSAVERVGRPSRSLRGEFGRSAPAISRAAEGAESGGEPTVVYDGDADGGLADRFPAGTLVRHHLFGVGRVEALTPRRHGTSARVNFKSVGIKNLVLEIARLERVL
jgi:DNA helicase-2/ATP-dependent DNA helicase PcrA